MDDRPMDTKQQSVTIQFIQIKLLKLVCSCFTLKLLKTVEICIRFIYPKTQRFAYLDRINHLCREDFPLYAMSPKIFGEYQAFTHVSHISVKRRTLVFVHFKFTTFSLTNYLKLVVLIYRARFSSLTEMYLPIQPSQTVNELFRIAIG